MGIIWKMRICFLSKVQIYITGSFQWSPTHAFVKSMLYLFGTRVPNRKTHTDNFRYKYMYRYTPIHIYIYLYIYIYNFVLFFVFCQLNCNYLRSFLLLHPPLDLCLTFSLSLTHSLTLTHTHTHTHTHSQSHSQSHRVINGGLLTSEERGNTHTCSCRTALLGSCAHVHFFF